MAVVQTTSARGDFLFQPSGTVSLAVTAGDDILVLASINDNGPASSSGDVTDSAGNTYTLDIAIANAVQQRVGIWRAKAGTTATLTITLNPPSANSYASWAALSARGFIASPLDKTSTNIGNTTPSGTGNTATLSQPDQLVVGVLGINTAGAAGTSSPATTGYTSLFVQTTGAAGEAGEGSYKEVTATTAVSANWTQTNGLAWAAVIATYMIASGQPTLKRAGGVPFMHGQSQSFDSSRRWIKQGNGLVVPAGFEKKIYVPGWSKAA